MRSLLVDDIRTFNTTAIARNYHDALWQLQNNGPWDIIYLDHDLGEGEKTGYDIIKYMEWVGIKPGSIVCVSANPVGREKINTIIERIYGKLFHNMYWAHQTAIIDPGADIGSGTKIWHYSHVMCRAKIGSFGNIGQNVFIGNVTIGDGCKIQNNVSVYDGVTMGNYVFLGPSCVMTNDPFPRAAKPLDSKYYSKIMIGDNASICANATIVVRPGRDIMIGEWALVGAGSVVVEDVPNNAVVVGNPARIIKYVEEHE